MRRSFALVTAALLTLGACATQDSKNVRTAGISPDMTVRATGDGVAVSVQLRVGGLNTARLDGQDSLTASARGRHAELHGGTFLGIAGYGAILGGAQKPGTTVTIAFARGSDDTSAPRSTVRMSALIEVAAPRAQVTLSRARTVAFRVNRAPGTIRVSWRGSCVAPSLSPTDFPRGTPVQLPPGAITQAGPTNGKPAPPSCPLTFTVTRELFGDVDPAFGGGQITAERTTSVVVRSVP